MTWFVLTPTANFKIKGTAVPQAEANLSDFKFSISTIGDYLRKPAPDSFEVPNLRLRFRAKLTDLMSAAFVVFPTHSLISKKMIECISDFKSPPCQLFNTLLIDRKNMAHPFSFLMQNSPQFDITDYDRSVFSRISGIRSDGLYLYEDFQAANFEDVLAKKGVAARALYMKENVNWDFFILAGQPFLWMVNEKVADALYQAKITGIVWFLFSREKI